MPRFHWLRAAAMKLGQQLSFMDVGIVPEAHRDAFQKKLAALRDAAPKVSFKDMRKVIEADLGEKLKEEFAEFDETPIAAASIGQVYVARLHDGRNHYDDGLHEPGRRERRVRRGYLRSGIFVLDHRCIDRR